MEGSRTSEGSDLQSSGLTSPSENKMAFPTLEGTSAWRASSDTWIP